MPRMLAVLGRSCLLVIALLGALPARAAEGPPLPELKDCLEAGAREKSGDYAQAVNFYSKCLETKNMSAAVRAAVLISRGNAYSLIGKPERAIDDFTASLQLDSKHSMAYNNRANTYRSIGMVDKAVADYTRAIELEPKNDVIYSNRGNAYKELKLYGKAEADYDQALKLNPSHVNTYYNRACMESMRGDTKAACTWLAKAFERGFPQGAAANDGDLDNIRDAACYKKLMEKK